MKLQILILATSYLLGSIPFGYILVRIFRKEDIRATGSGNIGATNVARSGAKGLGIATLVLDTLKALAAVLLAKHFFPSLNGTPSSIAAAAGVISIVGHMYPVWLGFRGGKGVASALGVFLALAPLVAVAALSVFILIVISTRLVSLASIAAAVSAPLFTLILPPGRSLALTGGIAVISALVILKHHANITRLIKGTESKFGTKKSPEVQA